MFMFNETSRSKMFVYVHSNWNRQHGVILFTEPTFFNHTNFFTILCTPTLSNSFTFLAVVCVSIGIVIHLLRALYKSKLNEFSRVNVHRSASQITDIVISYNPSRLNLESDDSSRTSLSLGFCIIYFRLGFWDSELCILARDEFWGRIVTDSTQPIPLHQQ